MEIKTENKNRSRLLVAIFIVGLIIFDMLIDFNLDNILQTFYPSGDNLELSQKNIQTVKHILFSVIISNFSPIILMFYTLLLSIDIIISKNIPARYIQLPIALNIKGKKAQNIGILTCMLSLLIMSSLLYEIYYAYGISL